MSEAPARPMSIYIALNDEHDQPAIYIGDVDLPAEQSVRSIAAGLRSMADWLESWKTLKESA